MPDELRGLLGTWFTEGQPFTFSVRDRTLEAQARRGPEAQAAVGLRPRSATTSTAPQSGRETGELLRVTRDANGAVTKLHWATYFFTREPYAFGEWLVERDE